METEGNFLVRISESGKCFVLVFHAELPAPLLWKTIQIRIQFDEKSQSWTLGNTASKSVVDLIHHFMDNGLGGTLNSIESGHVTLKKLFLIP